MVKYRRTSHICVLDHAQKHTRQTLDVHSNMPLLQRTDIVSVRTFETRVILVDESESGMSYVVRRVSLKLEGREVALRKLFFQSRALRRDPLWILLAGICQWFERRLNVGATLIKYKYSYLISLVEPLLDTINLTTGSMKSAFILSVLVLGSYASPILETRGTFKASHLVHETGLSTRHGDEGSKHALEKRINVQDCKRIGKTLWNIAGTAAV
jgi:hypothetical protein